MGADLARALSDHKWQDGVEFNRGQEQSTAATAPPVRRTPQWNAASGWFAVRAVLIGISRDEAATIWRIALRMGSVGPAMRAFPSSDAFALHPSS